MKYLDAIQILRDSDCILVDGAAVSTNNLRVYLDSNMPMVSLHWREDECFFEVEFFKEDNEDVSVAGTSMWLVDSQGLTCLVTPTFRKDLL